ncbi:hypothetical protein [Nitrospirillum amazonense]|uniref:hypothetical protein n=1 Tax=Nitrospirillum amazonense TaxID=28077 RepID=UPI002412B65A|nr:hypothetical protein [Nitrospirillum amazonense]MDG3444672.1 hypothetical protein [Nitrospirillum amazonense]
MANSIDSTDNYADGVMMATISADEGRSVRHRSDTWGNVYRARYIAGWNAVVAEIAERLTVMALFQ